MSIETYYSPERGIEISTIKTHIINELNKAIEEFNRKIRNKYGKSPYSYVLQVENFSDKNNNELPDLSTIGTKIGNISKITNDLIWYMQHLKEKWKKSIETYQDKSLEDLVRIIIETYNKIDNEVLKTIDLLIKQRFETSSNFKDVLDWGLNWDNMQLLWDDNIVKSVIKLQNDVNNLKWKWEKYRWWYYWNLSKPSEKLKPLWKISVPSYLKIYPLIVKQELIDILEKMVLIPASLLTDEDDNE